MSPLLAAVALLAQDPGPPFAETDRVVGIYYRPDAPGADPARDVPAMTRARFDVVLVVVRGAADLAPLAAALEAAVAAGFEAPRVAPCLEVPAGADPGTVAAEAIRRFDASIPARHRARIGERALLWLLPAPEGAEGKGAFEAFRPYLVAELSWKLAGDRTYRWGAGPRDYGVISIPAGGEDAAHEKVWFAALRLESRWAAVESWEAVVGLPERGKQRLESLGRLVRKFKINEKNALPKGKWTGAAKALFTTKYNPHEQGLRPVAAEGAEPHFIQLRGIAVLSTRPGPAGADRFLAFDVDDSYHFHERRSFELTVEFLDLGEGAFTVEYDAADRSMALPARHVRKAREVPFTATGDWREERIDLPDALFGNNQDGGADFRLALRGRGIAVRRLALTSR